MHRLFFWICSFALVLPCMRAQDFVVSQHGHEVGTVVCRGQSQAVVRVQQEGLGYTLSREQEMGAGGLLRGFELNAVVNEEAVRVRGSRVRDGWQMQTLARGQRKESLLTGSANAIVLADFDAGALEQLLMKAARSNGRDLWAIVPHDAGSIEAVRLSTLPDELGTRDGTEIPVHHMSFVLSGSRIELFSDDHNELLQAEYSDQGYAIVRRGFVLKPSAKPQTVE